MNMDKFLKAYCTEGKKMAGTMRSTGFVVGPSPDIEVPEGFSEVVRWQCKQFRYVWVNAAELSTITYCEGDIIVMQHDTRALFDKEISDSNLFYLDH